MSRRKKNEGYAYDQPDASCHSTSDVAETFGHMLPVLQQCGWAQDSPARVTGWELCRWAPQVQHDSPEALSLRHLAFCALSFPFFQPNLLPRSVLIASGKVQSDLHHFLLWVSLV